MKRYFKILESKFLGTNTIFSKNGICVILEIYLRIQDLINPKLDLSNLTGFENLSGLVSGFIKSLLLCAFYI